MARIRSIKPEFFTSEQVADCSPTARLLFIGIWTFSDDAGIHPASLRSIKMQVFPADEFTTADIDALCQELEKHGLLFRYRVDGKEYYWVTGWVHQRIEKPTYRYPWPDGKVPKKGQFVDWSTIDLRKLAERLPTESSRVESNGVESSRVETKPLSSVSMPHAHSRPPLPVDKPTTEAGIVSEADFRRAFDHITNRLPALATRAAHDINQWLLAGCDVEKDIIPTVDFMIEVKGGDIGSFKYFTQQIMSAKAARIDKDEQAERLMRRFSDA